MSGDPVAAMLVYVARLALSRGIALRKDERALLERAEELALEVLYCDPVKALEDECSRRGIQVDMGAVSLRDAAALAGISYRHALREFGGTGRGRRARIELCQVMTFIQTRTSHNDLMRFMDDFEARK